MKSPRRPCRPTVDAVTIPPVLLALVVAVAMLCAAAAKAQPNQAPMTCNTPAAPFDEICNQTGDICFFNYKVCHYDFDGMAATGFEQPVLFYRSQGSNTNPPFGDFDDRHCYQGEEFSKDDIVPDSADYGNMGFALLIPIDHPPGVDLPLYIALRGGSLGWVEVDDPDVLKDAWTLDFPIPGTGVWKQGNFRGGDIGRSRASGAETSMRNFMADLDGLIARSREKGWAIMVPSACSHDMWNGRNTLIDNDLDFEEAGRTRFSFTVVLEALTVVGEEFGIEYFFIGGGSAGGVGAFLFANDLPADLPQSLQGKFRGAILDSAPFEPVALADLYELDNPSDTRDVDLNSVCTDPPEATVPCDNPADPLTKGIVKIGVRDRSAVDSIGQGTQVPILHTWNSRDPLHCYDSCYAEDNLHGPIREAIALRKVGPIDEPFEFSESLRYCAGRCKGRLPSDPEQEVIVECTWHDNVGHNRSAPVEGLVDCASDWMDEINTTYNGDDYETPSSCLVTIEEGLDVPLVDCEAAGFGNPST